MTSAIRTDKKKSAPLESDENQQIKAEPNEERLPDFDIADRGHEQIEGGIRPLFVDEMKDRLIHARKARHDTEPMSSRNKRRSSLPALLCVCLLLSAWPSSRSPLSRRRPRRKFSLPCGCSKRQQQIDLQGQLREESTVVPFRLTQTGAVDQIFLR